MSRPDELEVAEVAGRARGRSGPGRRARASRASTVPMFGIARSRRQACSRSARSTRPRGDLARGVAQRQRAPGGEVEGLQLGRRQRGHPRRRRHVAQARVRAAAAEPADEPALDLERPLELDQLLGDRPRQRLPRVGAAVDPHVRARAHRDADHRVVGEALVERPQVVVDPGGEAHALDRRRGGGLAGAAGREQDALRRGLRDRHEHRLLAHVQQPHQRRAAAAQDAVARAAADPERPRRRHLDPQVDRRVPPG